MTRHR